jgi:hypothetical protein
LFWVFLKKGGLIMSLFKVGHFDEVGISFAVHKVKAFNVKNQKEIEEIALPQTLPLSAISELSYNIEIPTMNLAESEKSWGLFLRELFLNKSFEGFLANLFNPKNEIYFTSFAWDYSQNKPFIFPPMGAERSAFRFELKQGTSKKFIGDGINLWPTKKVVGALNLVILIWECDKDWENLGARLDSIHDIIEKSNLNKLITAISTNPSLATGVAIGMAVNELLGIIGKIMQRNQDDKVALFIGSWGTHKPQTAGVNLYVQDAASIEIEFVMT